jgi:HAD superfamily hydrolase (TIGR01509 family)
MITGKKAVIFDFDGTLVDSLWVWDRLDELYLTPRGIEIPKDFQQNLGGMSIKETASYYKEYFDLSDDPSEILAEWRNLIHEIYIKSILFKDSGKDLLLNLYDKGYLLGLGTSNDRTIVEDYLALHGVKDCFSSIHTTSEVGKSKPYPDIFLRVLSDFSLEKEDCIVIEDTYEGVMGAKNAGIEVIAIKDPYHFTRTDDIAREADFLIESLSELAY